MYVIRFDGYAFVTHRTHLPYRVEPIYIYMASDYIILLYAI